MTSLILHFHLKLMNNAEKEEKDIKILIKLLFDIGANYTTKFCYTPFGRKANLFLQEELDTDQGA